MSDVIKTDVKPDVKPVEKQEDDFVNGMTAADMKSFLVLMLQREKRAAQKEIEIERQQAARDKQHQANAGEHEKDLRETQANCDHRKGGQYKKRDKIDYALFYHIYINKKCVIGCQICRMKWRPGDTKQFLNQNGKRVPNHTGIGWDDVIELMAMSTNTMSSAEAPKIKASKQKTAYAGDYDAPSADSLPDVD